MGRSAATFDHTAEAPHYAVVIAWKRLRPIGGTAGSRMGWASAAPEKSGAIRIVAMTRRDGRGGAATGGVPACALCC